MHLNKLSGTLRNHLHFFIILPLIIILMTWPNFAQVFDTGNFWLATRNIDANMLFWDAWYLKLLLGGQADFYYTDLLFHPTGVSLAFHNFSLPHMIIFAGLQAAMPASNAFNATFLILSFVTATAGYIYLNYLFQDKWVALFGAVVFGAGAFILTRPAHANIAFIATIPLSLYFLHRGLLEVRLKLLLIAGALVGATAFIGMYTLVCLLIMLLAYLLYFAFRRWNQPVFWSHILIMLLVIGAFLALRFYPMLVDPQGISSALSKSAGREVGKDLLGYFVNTQHPVTQPILDSIFPLQPFDRHWNSVVFLGYIPMLLAALAFIRQKKRRRLLPWLLLAGFFLIMRLGSFLTFNGTDYPNVILPKHYLTQAFPHLFKPFWAVDNFHAGTLFPFAVLACFGLANILRQIQSRRRLVFILVLTGATAFELYKPQYPAVIPAERLEFIEWLRGEPDQETIRLINLPFAIYAHKVYGFYQTYNGYPHVAGRPTRTPATAFDYINSNFILSAWNKAGAAACLPGDHNKFLAAQDQLLSDGFTHIILHRYWRNVAAEAKSLLYLPAAYEDDSVSIYRVDDLHLNCNSSAILSMGAQHNLADLYGSGPALLKNHVSVLGIHSYEMTDGHLFDYYSGLDQGLVNLVPLRLENLVGGRRSSPRLPLIDHESALAATDIVLLAYDPRYTGPTVADAYEDWVSSALAPCGVLAESGSAVVRLYLLPGFPCALATAADPLGVQFDIDARLANVIAEMRDTALDVYFLWEQLPAENYSVSIQFFDAAGSKVYNQDFVLGDAPLAYHRIDMASLQPGDYQAKLILYNFETHASVSGEVISSGARFERELIIERVTVD
ncbi:MAG: hypothetical protein J4G18_03310 [Anaerolineae bacterium]|nr:hypothetical protein [Anaerolineae bacterium]